MGKDGFFIGVSRGIFGCPNVTEVFSPMRKHPKRGNLSILTADFCGLIFKVKTTWR
jgi:hypothetical protein